MPEQELEHNKTSSPGCKLSQLMPGFNEKNPRGVVLPLYKALQLLSKLVMVLKTPHGGWRETLEFWTHICP